MMHLLGDESWRGNNPFVAVTFLLRHALAFMGSTAVWKGHGKQTLCEKIISWGAGTCKSTFSENGQDGGHSCRDSVVGLGGVTSQWWGHTSNFHGERTPKLLLACGMLSKHILIGTKSCLFPPREKTPMHKFWASTESLVYDPHKGTQIWSIHKLGEGGGVMAERLT